jgi:hypothetical protein
VPSTQCPLMQMQDAGPWPVAPCTPDPHLPPGPARLGQPNGLWALRSPVPRRSLFKKKGGPKLPKTKPGEKRPTGFASFFLGAPFKRECASAVGMPPHIWAPAAGCGVFLYERVSSGDPLYAVFAKLFLSFFQWTFFPAEKTMKFVTGSTTTAIQSKSNSHVNVYYQPVEFTSFCLVCSLCCF